MALGFNESKGAAQKSDLNTYEYKNGENKVRIVGDILARYVYWVPGENGKNIPVECLGFNRDTETFENMEKDWVKEYYPDLNCQWGYVTQCIHEGEIKVLNLKKKLWESVRTTAKDLGDPTDWDTGWDIVFDREKTGPHIYNVKYELRPFACKVRKLSDAERKVLEDLKSMDDVMPRPTPEKQKEFMDRLHKADAPEENDEEAIEKEFDVD